MNENRQLVIGSLPQGPLEEGHFELRTSEPPQPGEGEVLCRTLAITIGAGQRAGLQGSASYAAPPAAGQVMNGNGMARVEMSRDPSIPNGAIVSAPTGWQEFSVHKTPALTSLPADADPAVELGALGINGLTAYFGLFDIGQPRPGDTVVVSAAAGSVGHVVAQMARIHGCRVVGVAGSEEKCRKLTDELGLDAAVNHKDPEFRAKFRAATPDRIDVYFDNTGGMVLESALFRMNVHGRIVCCGAVSLYDTANPGSGPRGVPGLLINNRVRMEGFLLFDYRDRYGSARDELTGWISSGQLRPWTTEYEGLESAPRAFIDLLSGVTVGTTIVHVGD
ncbi:MAG: NADP-dependent oxidoreductase [Acidimicrobiaceae bacterium]|nr:NADP-dependent oxidoreductase [Acidimicrobiaceae bacterium]